MAKKTNYWYVLVLTETGAKFVTALETHKYARWDELGKPLEMPQSLAKDVATGLMFNFTSAFPVCSPIELTSQPYNYAQYECKWTKKDKSENNA